MEKKSAIEIQDQRVSFDEVWLLLFFVNVGSIEDVYDITLGRYGLVFHSRSIVRSNESVPSIALLFGFKIDGF